MNAETRFSGHWIVGAQGTGKTTLLLNMLAADLQTNASIIIMDSKGDLTAPIRKLALGNRLVVLDPRVPFAINPLDVPKTDVKRAVNQLEYIFGALLGATVTPKQQSFLRSLLRSLIIAFPNPNLDTIDHFIKYGWKGHEPYIQKLPEDLHYFFHEEWHDYDATRNELKWRMRLLMETDLIKRMFSAPRTRFKIAEAMDRGDVFVIDNSQEQLHEDGSAFLGRFFVAQIWAAATDRASRPQHQKRPVYVYLDEAQIMIDSKIAAIIDQCRSQRIALILAHQRKSQIQDANILGALENCAIKMANVDAEASYFSELLHIPEERMNQLPRGCFAMHERGVGSSIVQVPPAELPYRMMTDAEQKAHQERMIALYGYEETLKPPEGGLTIKEETKPIVPLTKTLPEKSDPTAPSQWRKK